MKFRYQQAVIQPVAESAREKKEQIDDVVKQVLEQLNQILTARAGFIFGNKTGKSV